jgi:ABC-type branched-subunit amino acid transport system ATPase component
MAERRNGSPPASKPVLQVQDLQVYYGESHALQGVSLSLERGILSVVGRNGMGKTTLCNTIVGLMRARSGAIRFDGRDISKREPHEIARAGIGFVPQGRRLWPSLTVDETLRLCFRAGAGGSSWDVERIYATFPRLAERKSNGGGQLSGRTADAGDFARGSREAETAAA